MSEKEKQLLSLSSHSSFLDPYCPSWLRSRYKVLEIHRNRESSTEEEAGERHVDAKRESVLEGAIMYKPEVKYKSERETSESN